MTSSATELPGFTLSNREKDGVVVPDETIFYTLDAGYPQNKNRQMIDSSFDDLEVLPQGLEPWTPTLRVSCSTN